MTREAAHSLVLKDLRKLYGSLAAVDGVSLTVPRGRFLTLLGPSGSGKTTILMIIAGFVEPTGGAVLLDERAITHLPPEKRNFGMVFQGYALFPHLSVLEENAASRNVLHRLTAREREVLGFIASGADNLKIAVCLGITERTVKAHITSIYRKLDVENRTQMAMLACQLGVERPASV